MWKYQKWVRIRITWTPINCWWECNYWCYFEKLFGSIYKTNYMHILWLVTSPLGIHAIEICIYVHKKMCKTFMAALLIVTYNWKQNTSQLTVKWRNCEYSKVEWYKAMKEINSYYTQLQSKCDIQNIEGKKPVEYILCNRI